MERIQEYNKTGGALDLFMQSILYIPTVVFAIGTLWYNEFILAALSIQIFLGIYQVGSGLVGASRGDKWKIQYLLVVMVYFLVWGFGYILLDKLRFPRDMMQILMIIYVMVIPYAIGGYYFLRSILDYKQVRDIRAQKDIIEDNILDAGII